MDKKLAELEVSLYNCKQQVQIEPVKLAFHSLVVLAADRVEAARIADPTATDAAALGAAESDKTLATE